MRFTDLLTLPLVALWQQKTRTSLTTLGVAFGAFVLAASLSINDGVQQTIRREAGRDDVLRKIDVRRGGASTKKQADVEVEGRMSAAKQARIREALVAYHARLNSVGSVDLTPEMLDKLAHIEHVATVEPAVTQWGFAMYNGHSENTAISSARPNAPGYVMRLVAGRFFERPAERAAVVSEFLLYRFGITDEKDVENVLNRKIRLEIHHFRQQPGIFVYLIKDDGSERTQEETKALARLSQRLPSVLDQLGLSPEEAKLLRQATSSAPLPAEDEYVEELPIIGVIREPSASEHNDRRWWESLGDGDVVLRIKRRPISSFACRNSGSRAFGSRGYR